MRNEENRGGQHRRSAGTTGLASVEEMERSEHLAAVRAGEVGSLHSWELVTAVDGPGTGSPPSSPGARCAACTATTRTCCACATVRPSTSTEVYRATTGRELQPTLDFGRRLADLGKEIGVRFVLVPGLTDGVENVAAVADYAASLPAVARVEVLPFHQMGRDKWERLGTAYQLGDSQPPEPHVVEGVREQFRSRGLTSY